MNLGAYQADGVICDLAPHDLSILLYWLERPVSHVAATACTVFQDDVPETAFLTVSFEGGPTANVQISWLAPRKVRQMVVVGSARMVQYEDTASDDTVRVYDRGLDFSRPANYGEYTLTYRSGDMVAPKVEAAEPLSLELEDFARAIRTGAEPRSTPALGLEIVRALEAAQESLANDGVPVALGDATGTGATPSGIASAPMGTAPARAPTATATATERTGRLSAALAWPASRWTHALGVGHYSWMESAWTAVPCWTMSWNSLFRIWSRNSRPGYRLSCRRRTRCSGR